MFEHDPLVTLLLVLTAFQVVALTAAWLMLRRRPLALSAPASSLVRRIDRLAQRPLAAVLLVFLLAFSLSALLAAVHWPVPRIQDEFSYRLAGETFAAGRMTNPPHPMWPHLESEHILHQPTYMSKYPPMQGLALAAGNIIAGTTHGPMLGAWLGLAAASAAVCWMFFAFLPARWAVIGGLLVASHPWILAWWGHSAWGGQMAMLGGALLFGSLRRIVGDEPGARPRAAHALILGIGLAILANSRPYEGLIASLPAAAILAWRTLGPHRLPLLDSLTRIALPIAAVLVLAGAAMSMYNQRITGDPLTLPYQLHSKIYNATPMFLWQDLPPEPDYRDRKLRDFHAGWERGLALDQRTPYTLARKLLHKSLQFCGFYLGPALGIATLGLCIAAARRRPAEPSTAARSEWVRFAAGAAMWTLAASLLCVWFNPHYVAPVAPLVLLLAVVGLRRLAESGSRGARLAAAALIAHATTAAALLIAAPLTYPTDDRSHARAEMIADLAATGEKHLVILRHGREYSPHEEWVYNAADIDASPVVWARELDSAGARALREHFRDRRHWLLHAYRPPRPDGTRAPIPRPEPYPDLPPWLGEPPHRLLVGESIGPVLITDIDDNAPVLIAAPIARPALEVYRAGQWDAPITVPLPAPASALAAAEPDVHGHRRIVAALAGQPALVIMTLPSAGAPELTHVTLPAEARSVAIIPGGNLLAVSCASPSGVAFIGLDGHAPSQPWLTVGSELHGIVAADLNSDGIPDIAACDRTGSAVWLMPGRLDGGSWSAGTPVRLGDIPEAIGICVLDTASGGAPSLAAASAATDSIMLLTSAADGTWTVTELPTGVVPLATVAVDVDGDGLLDIAVATRWGHGLSILRNLGPAGGFAPPAEVTLGTQTWFVDKAARLAAGDLDGDGTADIAVGAADGVHVFLSGR